VAAPEAVAAVAIDHSGSNRFNLQLEMNAAFATDVALMRAQHTPTGPGPDRGETLVAQATGRHSGRIAAMM
jgi:hypothetical protein